MRFGIALRLENERPCSWANSFVEVAKAAGEMGILTLIHCEDAAIISVMCQSLLAEGRGSLRYYADSRPVVAEEVATQRAVAMCEATGSPIYVVHLSSERALRVCERAMTSRPLRDSAKISS